MPTLIAQAQESIMPALLQTIDNNGVWIFVGFCVLAGTAKHLVGRILRHNERLAMISAGMNPDADSNEDRSLRLTTRRAG